MRIKRGLIASLLLAVAGCSALPTESNPGDGLVAEGRYEEAIAAYEREAGRLQSAESRAQLLAARERIADRLMRDARSARASGQPDDAERSLRRLAQINPADAAVRAELAQLQRMRELDGKTGRAEELLRAGRPAAAESLAREVLLAAPEHARAQRLMQQIQLAKQPPQQAGDEAAPAFRKRLSMEFKELPLRAVFDAIWRATGINFIIDRDVKTDEKVSIFVGTVTAEEAIEAVLLSHQLARKQVNAKTLFIFPRTSQKLAENQDMVVRNFFLAHADAKQLQILLKTVLKIKDVYLDERRNILVIRDSVEQVALAEKLITAHDQAEPEVMLALDVIEVRRSRLKELGLSAANQVTFGVASPISLEALRTLGSAGVNVGFSGTAGTGNVAAINLQDSDGDANTLANPRIRVRNREKAKFHIGDRLPVVTTTSSSTSSFVGETVNYLDVGLKLEVEPQVLLDDHVVVKLNLEVSSATQSKVNPKFYDVGTRNTSTVLTIRDGETQVLAGLIRDDERDGTSRIPGLGNLPVIGRLFSSTRREEDKTEILLAITPRVLSNLYRPSAELTSYPAGTDAGGASGNILRQATPQPASPATARARRAGVPAGATPAPEASSAEAAPVPIGVMPLEDFELPPGVGQQPAAPAAQ